MLIQNREVKDSLDSEIRDSLFRIKQYLETDICSLRKETNEKNTEIKSLKEELEKVQLLLEGNRQLINKLLGEINKLQNDIEWYKKTYEMRSLLGTIREKLLKKKA